jgi:outer membrane biosynthesis protein TonB
MNALATSLWHDAMLCLAAAPVTYLLLWGGSLAITVTLIVLLLTKWGHSQPLHKCAVLSLIVHLILATLTMTVRIVNGDGSGGGGGGGGAVPIHVRIVEEIAAPVAKVAAKAAVREPAKEAVSEVAAPPLLAAPAPEPIKEKPAKLADAPAEKPKVEPAPAVVETLPKESKDTAKKIVEAPAKNDPPTPVAKPVAAVVKDKPVVPEAAAAKPTESVAKSSSAAIEPTADSAATDAEIAPSMAPQIAEVKSTGNIYALRSAPGRLSLIKGQGGNAQTEAAVAAALKWLAAAQAKDGRWDAVQYGAGQEEMSLGQNRGNAGRNADTGITALALLAFLGAGQSHTQGEYQDTVRHGLDFLLRSQAEDGSMFGEATLYAQMYCHSMATFALAEAQALTGDRRLQAAVVKAVNFCLAAQNASTGGWRYRPGDTGDTSQLGWQIMALTSAHRAGIKIPDQTWNRVTRFLRSVERGANGGLASYRADSPMSTSMTAEALYCRLMIEDLSGAKLPDVAATEATTQLLASPPGADRMNLYYWYYATLALHHRQNASDAATSAWRTWNESMTATLTKAQARSGKDAGSWDSNQIWGGYGGQIYTTAMATMCLEVYYRYAPTPRRGMWSAERPQAMPAPR